MQYQFTDLVDLDRLRPLLDGFTTALGSASALIGTDGKVLIASGWQDICVHFHRTHPASCKRCIESDTLLASQLQKGKPYNVYRCKNGLVDVAVPVFIEGMHVGNVFMGQFLFEPPNLEFFRNQAAYFGFDETAYLEALSRVPVFSRDQIKVAMDFLASLAELIGTMGLAKKRLKETNEELREKKKQREELIEKLEAQNAELERFAYTTSHDLKAPLVTVKGFLGALKEDLERNDDKAVQDDLLRIEHAADKMMQLLRDLLELSRVGRLVNPPQDISMAKLIQEAVELVSGQITARGVRIDIQPRMPVVFGDRPRLLEVFQNLIDNAVKYMGDQPKPRIEIGTQHQNGHCIYFVRDNGIGIDPRYQEKVFGLFEQLNPQIEGSGIGLALVKRIVEVHRGQIWLESEGPQRGSTFFLTLPGVEKTENVF